MLIQLIAVVDVVPHAVEATGDARDGCHEGVAHPDGKDDVLLSACLCRANHVVVFSAYMPADGKLDDTCQG